MLKDRLTGIDSLFDTLSLIGIEIDRLADSDMLDILLKDIATDSESSIDVLNDLDTGTDILCDSDLFGITFTDIDALKDLLAESDSLMKAVVDALILTELDAKFFLSERFTEFENVLLKFSNIL